MMNLLRSFIIAFGALDFNIPLIKVYEVTAIKYFLLLSCLYLILNIKLHIPSIKIMIMLILFIVFILTFPLSDNYVFYNRVEDIYVLSCFKIVILSIILLNNMKMLDLLMFVYLSFASLLIIVYYQLQIFGSIMRPNTFSGSSSVFLLQIILLLNIIASKNSYFKVKHFMKLKILAMGVISGSGKLILVAPLILKDLRLISRLFLGSAAATLLLVFSRSLSDIYKSLGARLSHYSESDVIHSTFELLFTLSNFTVITVFFFVFLAFFSLANLNFKTLFTLFILLITFALEHQLFGDNLFTTSCILANIVLLLMPLTGRLRHGPW